MKNFKVFTVAALMAGAAVIIIAMFLFFPAVGIPTAVQAQEPEMPFVMAYGSDIGELNPLVWRSE